MAFRGRGPSGSTRLIHELAETRRVLIDRHQLLDSTPASRAELRSLGWMVEQVGDGSTQRGRITWWDIEAVWCELDALALGDLLEQADRTRWDTAHFAPSVVNDVRLT